VFQVFTKVFDKVPHDSCVHERENVVDDFAIFLTQKNSFSF
jgi:hypothetical protein